MSPRRSPFRRYPNRPHLSLSCIYAFFIHSHTVVPEDIPARGRHRSVAHTMLPLSFLLHAPTRLLGLYLILRSVSTANICCLFGACIANNDMTVVLGMSGVALACARPRNSCRGLSPTPSACRKCTQHHLAQLLPQPRSTARCLCRRAGNPTYPSGCLGDAPRAAAVYSAAPWIWPPRHERGMLQRTANVRRPSA